MLLDLARVLRLDQRVHVAGAEDVKEGVVPLPAGEGVANPSRSNDNRSTAIAALRARPPPGGLLCRPTLDLRTKPELGPAATKIDHGPRHGI